MAKNRNLDNLKTPALSAGRQNYNLNVKTQYSQLPAITLIIKEERIKDKNYQFSIYKFQ